MEQIINYLKHNKKFEQLIEDTREEISCANDASFAFYLAYQYLKHKELKIVVVENMLAAQNLYNQLSLLVKEEVFLYCVDEVTKFTSLASSPELLAQRLFVLQKVMNQENAIIITHTMAIKRLTPNKRIYQTCLVSLKNGMKYEFKNLLNRLIKLGYKNVYKVTQPLEYSTRGGVIDIYSINYPNPVRIEFFDTEIESVRFFDVESQRTLKTINEVLILPATEFLVENIDKGITLLEEFASQQIKKHPNNVQLQSVIEEDIEHLKLYDFNETYYKYYAFFDNYSTLLELANENTIYFYNYDKIQANNLFIEGELSDTILNLYEDGMTLKGLKIYKSLHEIRNELKHERFATDDVTNRVIDFNFTQIDSFDFSFDLLYKSIIEWESHGYVIYIGLENETHYHLLKQYLNDKDIDYKEVSSQDKFKTGLNIGRHDYHIGLNFTDYKFCVVGEKEIFNKRFKSTMNQFSKYKNSITISSVNDLSVGDYLVHEFHGIGKYMGIETILNNGVHRDYLKIEYKNNSMLYLPLEQFKLVRKFISKDGMIPHVNKLGSKEWENTKKKIKERVNEIAEKLVKLYSLRVEKPGFEFAKDDELQISFEEEFDYELTPDQKTVLKEIKQDMERPIIMDRLLVGDVGFGKTEIALRAAFKAILSGKQVALLCPTTLLARQHYMTALERFRNFGVNIKMLSRLISDKEQTQVLKNVKEGNVNLLIGTHRLLSKDVLFKDLGLLIVDEEHKFGVEHKEKIKEMKQNVDVLTLSATPIPRTLQMALTGVRGFSTINTPISTRMPVQTYVIKKERYAIKEIIERELARGGQVFYLNNKIERLPQIARDLSNSIKGAKVCIAHGQLPLEVMEDTMQAFINKEYNILLCTTIIENGIDIPNVNTILVENADCFGLSQLYQIKGRVGRGDRLAYAYLMYKGDKELSDIAKKRLQTIKEFASLGSGYKVAMRDLITRGAGDLLGEEQSGFIDSVGIDMYIEMLHNAINHKKDPSLIVEEDKIKPVQTLNIDAYIPETYFNNDFEKIDLYKRIDKIKTLQELNALKDEMVDKTGQLPESIDMLFEKKHIDLFESKGLIESYLEFDKYIMLKLTKDFNTMKGIGISIFELASNTSNAITLKFQHNQIEVQIKKVENWLYLTSKFITALDVLKMNFKEMK